MVQDWTVSLPLPKLVVALRMNKLSSSTAASVPRPSLIPDAVVWPALLVVFHRPAEILSIVSSAFPRHKTLPEFTLSPRTPRSLRRWWFPYRRRCHRTRWFIFHASLHFRFRLTVPFCFKRPWQRHFRTRLPLWQRRDFFDCRCPSDFCLQRRAKQ